MPETLMINISKPITSVKISDKFGADGKLFGRSAVNSEANAEEILRQDLEAKKAEASQLCQTLKGLVAKLNRFNDKVFSEARDGIAKLSVEIARKILVQKAQEGDYKVETIVKEALKNAPTSNDVVVHLHPEDLVQCQKVQQDDAAKTLAGIKFVADTNIGRAECLIETPKGIIESLINEQLEQVSEALKKAK